MILGCHKESYGNGFEWLQNGFINDLTIYKENLQM